MEVSPAQTELDAALRAAYEAARYVAWRDGEVVQLRVGEASEALRRLHAAHGVASSAVVTAYNPLGARLDDATNRARQQALAAELARAGHEVLPARGEDPAGAWPGEASALVLGVTRAEAAALGARHGQNAVLWAGDDGVPRLVLLR